VKITRLNWVLLAVVLSMVGADQALRGQGPSEREVGRLLPELFLDKANRVLLEHDGKRLELQLAAEQEWVMPGHFNHPADAGRLRNLIQGLISITTLDLLTMESERHADYGVDDGAISVRVWDESGSVIAGLLLGDMVPGGGASYVRRAGDDATYRAPRLRTISLEPNAWLDVRWMPFEPTMVDRLTLGGSDLDAPVVLVREEGTVDKWRYESGDVLAPSRVKSMLQTLRALFLAEVVGSGQDQGLSLGEPRFNVELRLADGRVLAGTFGTITTDGSVLASRTDTRWVVRFSPATWENLRREARGLVQ